MKYLIVGLGNIGAEYAATRHNIGFKVLDALAEASNTVFSSQRYGSVAELKHKGRTFILLKPSTYMNLSGKAVSYWMQAEKIPLENVFVIVDDIALPFGTIRIRAKGSDECICPAAVWHRGRFSERNADRLRTGRMDKRGGRSTARAHQSGCRGDQSIRHDRA